MKYVRGLKIGGLQQKIFNLMLIFVLLLVGAFVAVSVYQQHHLSDIVSEAGNRQQASITDVSEATMEAVLERSLTKTTALQAYIAGDLFGDVKADVQTLQAFATELFGTDRMLAALNENTSASPEELLKNVRRAVDGFVKDAEQFDDLTMLGLEYKGVSEE